MFCKVFLGNSCALYMSCFKTRDFNKKMKKKPHGSLSVKLFRIAKPGVFLLIFDVVLFIKLFKVTLAICLSTTRTLVFSRARVKTFNPLYIFNF